MYRERDSGLDERGTRVLRCQPRVPSPRVFKIFCAASASQHEPSRVKPGVMSFAGMRGRNWLGAEGFAGDSEVGSAHVDGPTTKTADLGKPV